MWSPNDPKTNDLYELLNCLRRKGAISGELAKKLKELEIYLPAFLKCVGERCRSTADELEDRQPQKQYDPAVAQLAGVSLERLVEVIAKRMGERLR